MSSIVERVLSMILVACAVVLAVSVARREFRSPPPAVTAQLDLVEGWEKALEVGNRVGETNAKVRIIEFADLQCPACKRFQQTIEGLLKDYPRDVALYVVHFPLPGHAFALPAARASECANEQGSFYPIVRLMYQKQDSLGIKAWSSYATEAGVSDVSRFATCVSDTVSVKRIDAGLKLASDLSLTATPTVLVNGWRFSAPTRQRLEQAVRAVQQGHAVNEIGR